jgi:hypothetical protein
MQRRSAVWLVVTAVLAVSPIAAQPGPGEFTVIALPDTQFYSQSYPHIFTAQTDWIVRNKANLGIKFVLGLGDIVNHGERVAEQANADASVSLLDQAKIPYLLALGNHDYENSSPKTRNVTTYNRYFGPTRYAGQSWYRGNFPAGSNENFYGVFTIDGRQYLIMALEFYPRNAVLSWASSVIAANPDKNVILILHAYLNTNSRRVGFCDGGSTKYFGITQDNDGEEMWSKLMSRYGNIAMVLNGHFHGTGRRADLGEKGNLVNQILADYQSWPNGGGGYLRIMTFRPLLNRVDVKTYSPFYDQYLTDAANQFSIPLYNPAPGAAGVGTVAGRVRSAEDCRTLSGVKISSALGSATTDSAGRFTLTGAAPSRHNVTASAAGWSSSTLPVKIDASYTAQLDFYLSPAAGSGARISAPLNGAVVSSPTRVVASASSSNAISTMHLYVDNRLAYSTKGASIDLSVPLQAGARYLVVQAWDVSGAVFKKSHTITVAAPGITVQSPGSGATVSSPVQVLATATSSNPITTVHIYVDNKLAYSSPSTRGNISTSLQLARGSHNVVVQAWDQLGNLFKKAITVTVR